MALVDWEVIIGGGLGLDTTYKVSGEKSLTQTLGQGSTYIVHKNTYNDAPKNIRMDTWFTHEKVNTDSVKIFIGGIARKQSNKDTYFFWFVELEIDANNNIVSAYFKAGYYIDGTKSQLVNEDIHTHIVNEGLGVWYGGKWRFVRIEGYESNGKFNVSVSMTPNISTPDTANPPVDKLIMLGSASMDIPTELQDGGACGLVVGSIVPSGSYATTGRPFYDYTQIYY